LTRLRQAITIARQSQAIPHDGSQAVEAQPSGVPNGLVCPVCLELMADKSPKALKCGHTFCQECISRIGLINGKLPCPICRQKSKMSELRPVYF
jgi:hypothetical protein